VREFRSFHALRQTQGATYGLDNLSQSDLERKGLLARILSAPKWYRHLTFPAKIPKKMKRELALLVARMFKASR